jgi:branched-chain amino acid transport system permease protein
LSGPYLAGATLALAVGIPSLANQFHFLGGEAGLTFDIGDVPHWAVNNWIAKIGGADFTSYKWLFWIVAPIALITLWILHHFLYGATGRRFKAMRSHPAAAALIGMDVAQTKVLAFTASAALAGLAGAMFAMVLGLAAPLIFTLALSFTLVTGAVLSGISALYGGIIGAMVLVAIPELSASVATHLGGSEKVTANLPGVITSVLLILTVLILPNGAQFKMRKSPIRNKKVKA